MSRKIEVDTKTFVRFWLVILGFALVGLFVYKALTGLIIVGISIFLAIAIRPLVEKIDSIDKKRKHPALSATMAYLIVVLVIGIIIAVIGPVVIQETSKFINNQLPEVVDGINDFGNSIGVENLKESFFDKLDVNSWGDVIGKFGDTLFSGIGTIAGFITSIILVLVLTLLFLLEGPAMMNEFWSLLSGKHRNEPIEEARRITSRMARVISSYVSKQISIALLDGAMTVFVVFLLSIIFGFSAGLALPMGMITAILYLIPMFGQIIGCALVAILLLFNSPIAALVFAIFYIVYAQVENNLIAPKVQGDSLNLPPVMILVAITIGVYMFGLIGAIVAVPIAGCIRVLLEEYPRIRELQEGK